MAVTKEEVVDFIKGMTVLELSEFVKELEQTFGVSAAAPVAMAAMPAALPRRPRSRNRPNSRSSSPLWVTRRSM